MFENMKYQTVYSSTADRLIINRRVERKIWVFKLQKVILRYCKIWFFLSWKRKKSEPEKKWIKWWPLIQEQFKISEAAVLTSKETFTLTCGTARQRADIRRKLKEDFVVLPILVDRDELLLNNRLAKSNLFRVEDNSHIHMAAGTIKKHLYYQYSPSTLLLQL